MKHGDVVWAYYYHLPNKETLKLVFVKTKIDGIITTHNDNTYINFKHRDMGWNFSRIEARVDKCRFKLRKRIEKMFKSKAITFVHEYIDWT